MEEILDERKRKILRAIIQTYQETGEPVGSRTISKYTDLNLSSATIRNEMSDLTDMGYIIQPHTSAGRIPSDKGYRFYVDALMEEKDQEIAEIKELMIQKTDKMEKVLKQVARVLAANTNYATMITAPQVRSNKLRFIQLSRVNALQLLAVVVAEGNVIRNQIIDLEEEMDDETILKLNLLLNTNLNGLPIADINLGMIARLKEQAGIHSHVVGTVLDSVANAIQVDDEDLEIYTSGATNIFKYPELSDSAKASELISAFEEKQELVDLVRETMGEENTGIQVYIGQVRSNKLRFIQLSRVNALQLLAVVVAEGNVIRNQIIDLEEEMDDETILKLNLLLNTNLNGLPIADINLGMIARLKEQAGIHSHVVGTVLDSVANAIQVDDEDLEIYTSGATNIFKYPELSDSAKASELISAFEEKQELVDLVRETMGEENTGIQVYIGNEAPIKTMKDCSIVTATYDLGNGMQGTIGIIGPKRMDYENVVDSLKTLKIQLDKVFNNKT